ncbi:DUF1707 domain-containing protein [Actinocorallia longicatena]|uniref:DUF1707 domain-containing protein n=1 Tax=Actinocorallia longicatena TaxID=111803 RepID=A0ABP6QHB9_9ACTN
MKRHERHVYGQMYAQQAWLAAQQWLPNQASSPDLRIGDAERTAVTEALQQHYAEGRLDGDELEQRLDATLAAKTAADLTAITKDLPGPRTWEQQAVQPRQHHRPHPRHHGHHHPHRHGRFFKAPLAILLFVVLPVAFIFHMPGLVFIAFRVMLVLFFGSLIFSFVRRRFARR